MTDEEEREREAEWRWGNTDAFRESQKRVAQYGPAEWARIQSEGKQILDAYVALMKKRGLEGAECDEAMALAELYREYNSRWWYETSHEMHAMLAEGYVADERFKKTYEDIAPGLAEMVSRSIIANAMRAGANLAIDDALANVRAAMGVGAAPVLDEAAVVVGKQERRARELAARRKKK
jgi:MerR family transcriptional regulator, thiopeptide resistance regulator